MDKEISRKAAHNARVQSLLLRKAAPLFREKGPDHVGIDEVMSRAGMTRGAFYAHFASKDDVFLASLRQETPLLRSLESRAGQSPDELRHEMRAMFEEYLSNKTPSSAQTCTLAGLAMDVARTGEDARATHEAMQLAMRVEMARDMDVHHDDDIVHATLGLAIGAVILAAAQRTETGQDRVLQSARNGVNDLLDGFLAPKIEDVAPPQASRTEHITPASDECVGSDPVAPPRPDIPVRPALADRRRPQRPIYSGYKNKAQLEQEPTLIGKVTGGVKKLFS